MRQGKKNILGGRNNMRKRLCGKEEELKEGNYNWHAQKGKTGPDKGDTTL